MRKVVIIEDEPNTQQHIAFLMKGFADYEVVGSFYNAASALVFLCENEVDIVLLDMNLPDMSGFDMIRRVEDKSLGVIVISGYEDYAIESFKIEKHVVVDYIRKPVYRDQLAKALAKYEEQLKLMHSKRIVDDERENPILVLVNNQRQAVVFRKESIMHIYKSSSLNHFCRLRYYNGEVFTVKATLADIQNKLPEYFVQITRSDIVNLKRVNLGGNQVTFIRSKLKISKNYRISEELLNKYQSY